MDVKQLSYFVRVAELGSFTRASIVLDIAQPALSRQVRLLEVELRQNLLVRNGRGITLTEAGKVLLEHSRGVLHQMERLREELSRVRGSLAGRVAVGMPPTLGRILAVPVTREFKQLMPDATLSINEGLSKTMQESLLTGQLDIALVYNAFPTPGIELRPVLQDELLLVQGPGGADSADPVELKDIARYPLIIPSRPNAIRMHVETALLNIGVQPRIAMEVDGVATILDLVADGVGNAVLSRHAVITAAQPERFTMRRITNPGLYPLLSVATSANRPATSTQHATLELLERVAREVLLDKARDEP
ncbi:LysR substrate-binding domain-containing protein [Pseudoduganella namucuonensis]|uniref:Transcriptional regulator, LysR family n=1 Tax=Pseudoduganella namucuonensis TaxID=1035707 RepID=A0A1I7K705_9BURK|nr:LysR substrate-binding domain-containing protein [Pseudoduganella namucuonensis]SFU93223.1 transcriptional regulator, LysR family [Pseudoduganella namucuonensis]